MIVKFQYYRSGDARHKKTSRKQPNRMIPGKRAANLKLLNIFYTIESYYIVEEYVKFM